MSATDTALRVLDWATVDPGTAAPEGDLSGAHELAQAQPALRRAVARLAAVTTARLRIGAPPLGDASQPGLGAALLAAALGGRASGEPARRLALAAPPPRAGYDVISYFGVTAPAGRSGVPLPASVAVALVGRSPLTGLLDAPADAGAEFGCEDLLARLLEHPDGRRLAVRRLAEPPTSDHQLAWRGDLLTRFRLPNPDFVLDVYETALEHFGAWYRDRTRACRADLVGPHRLAAAQPLATWWRALAELERARRSLLRTRPRLAGYLDGVRLHWRYQYLQARQRETRR
jgi:hypothetical protein